MYDIIIVGAGPAGLTAALYALRANKNILILEAKAYGGQIVNAHLIRNYPGIEEISGFDFATNLYNQVKKLGGEIKYETVIRITNEKKVITNENEYDAKSIILATGSENKKLNLPKESDFIGKGISYCATCDGHFYKDKVVAVAGDEDVAIEDAIYLCDLASKVYIIHSEEELKGTKQLINELKSKKNIEYINNTIVTDLHGSNTLTSIDIEDKDKKVKNLEVDGLFIAIGQQPKNQIFSNIVDIDENGYIKSKDGIHTSFKGIYVAGDARVKELRQLVTATSDGANSVMYAIKEMN